MNQQIEIFCPLCRERMLEVPDKLKSPTKAAFYCGFCKESFLVTARFPADPQILRELVKLIRIM